MKQDIFDGGGSFESAFWTGEQAYASPRNTTDQKMELEDGSAEKQKKEEKKAELKMELENGSNEQQKKEKKKTELKNEEYLTS